MRYIIFCVILGLALGVTLALLESGKPAPAPAVEEQKLKDETGSGTVTFDKKPTLLQQLDHLDAAIDRHLKSDADALRFSSEWMQEKNQAYNRMAWYLSEAMRQSGVSKLTMYSERPVYLGPPPPPPERSEGSLYVVSLLETGPFDAAIAIRDNGDGTVTLERGGGK